jgi:hypothetical protein
MSIWFSRGAIGPPVYQRKKKEAISRGEGNRLEYIMG